MPIVRVIVKPADKSFIGWDVRCASWKSDQSRLIWHMLVWTDPDDGTFVGESGDLPSGTLAVRAAVIDPGRAIELEIDGQPEIIQPFGASWPMSVEVDGGVGTQGSDTWYFSN